MQTTDITKPKTLSIEEVLPLFMDEDLAQIMPDIRLYRVDSSGYRYYYQVGQDQAPIFYLSVTSFTRSVLPESKFLTDWRVRLGKEESEEAARVAASYGTFLHTCIANFMREGYYDHNETPSILSDYMQFEGIPGRFFGPWMDDLENDVLAFAQFCVDRNVKPLAIEFPVCGMGGLAGMIDLICQMDFNRKRVAAIVDFKSGRKGFWDDHALQLKTYQELSNGLFSGTPYEVEMTFNWAPNDWRDKPTYKLENQTESEQVQRFPHYLELFKLSGNRNPSRSFKRMTRALELGAPLDGCFEVVNIVDFVTQKIKDDARQAGR